MNRLKEELMNKDKVINGLTLEFSAKESDYVNQLQDLRLQLEKEISSVQNIFDKYEKLDKEMVEMVIFD
jgi:hypothetical protein